MSDIILDDYHKVMDEFYAFMMGLDDHVEKTIIRYIYENHFNQWVSFQDIKHFTMVKSLVCFNQRRLSARLASLTNFHIIDMRTDPDSKTYYRLNEQFIKELILKKEAYY